MLVSAITFAITCFVKFYLFFFKINESEKNNNILNSKFIINRKLLKCKHSYQAKELSFSFNNDQK